MTKPLVPAHVDLRDFAFMPLDAVRLRDSSLAVEASGDEFRAAVLLWCVAWHQVPAASLPDNDRVLANYVGFGRDLKSWRKVREGALRGFVPCDDGRLYHAILSQKAGESWEKKLRHWWKREYERLRKIAARNRVDINYPTFDEWREHFDATGDEKWPLNSALSHGTDEGQAAGQPSDGGSIKVREGKVREGKGYIDSLHTEASTQVSTDLEPAALACSLMSQAGCKSVNVSRPELLAALAEGITPQQLGDAAGEAVQLGKNSPFAWAIATTRKRQADTPKAINGAGRVVGRAPTPSSVEAIRKHPIDPQVVGGFMAKVKEHLGL